jgi:CMP/dCMP kinase
LSLSISSLKIVTIDGPAGGGKSTVAAKLAKRLDFIHLNSGALFRAVGIRAKEQGLDFSDGAALSKLARSMNFEFWLSPEGDTDFLVDQISWRDRVKTGEAGEFASQIALVPELRDELVRVQHEAAKKADAIGSGVVLEGRDAGTVVFPEAKWKFYLDAPSSVRAERRWRELCERAQIDGTRLPDLAAISRDVEERDLRDRTREIAPQVMPEDAYRIDTTDFGPDEVVEQIAARVSA